MLNTKTPYFYLICWLGLGCFLVYVMVILGGATRLTNSGLSMVNWSATGTFPPVTAERWETEFSAYKQSPEFRIINKTFTLEDFKSIFWLEFIHRMTGRLTGIIFLLPFLFFLIKKKFPSGFVRKMLIILSLGIAQGALGWFMVKSGLQKDPHVSHYRLTAHLLMALLLFSFIFWFLLDLQYREKKVHYKRSFKFILYLFLIILILQISYGAMVAGLKAGFLFQTFPKMGNVWIPDMHVKDLGWRVITEGHAAVQFIHRLLGYLLFALGSYLYFRSRSFPKGTNERKYFQLLYGVLLIQIILGIITVVFGVPILTALMHQTGAFVLLSFLLLILHTMRRALISF